MALPSIVIQGNVTIEPNLQFTANGKAMVRLSVAANESRKTDAGKWETTETIFLNCTLWGAAAESCVETVTKGTPVVIVGKLTQRVVEKDGAKQTYFDVRVDSLAVDIKKSVRDNTSDPWASEVPF